MARYLLSSEGNGDHSMYGISLIKSVQLFVSQCLRKFLEDVRLSLQSFREDRLWQPEVRLLYSMNETQLRDMFSIYVARNRG